MASEIWKIGQEHNADKVFNEIKDKGVPGCFLLRGEVVAVSALTKICAEMINAYNDVIEDQNSYLLEIDDMVQKLDDINDDIQAKIRKLMN